MTALGPSLSLVRVVALVGALGVAAAFFMPWFSSQGLLLSGQFLHNFLSNASPSDLRRFLPNSRPSEVQLLRLLVDLFPVCGLIGAVAVLAGAFIHRGRVIANVAWALSGLVPLGAWAVGIRQLPPGANPEVGLWLIGGGSLAVVVGGALELWTSRSNAGVPQRAPRTSTS